jgi:hypothetical protein
MDYFANHPEKWASALFDEEVWMKRFFACALALTAALPVACTDPAETPGTGDAGGPDAAPAIDGGDGGGGGDAGALGFHPSNLDTATQLEATLAGPLGDLVLSDCGPQVDSSENGRVGCEGPGEVYKQIDGYGGDQKYAVFVAKNIKVAADRDLLVHGDRPLILVALETIEIEGGITVDVGFAGGFTTDTVPDGKGPGAGKGSSDSTSGSGGGGAFCGKGGNGGAPTAKGGAPYGTPAIIPLQGGSSGGGLFGAEGGGAIQLVAGREIIVKSGAFIDAHGNGAVKGGGAGGAILLEAPVVKVEGSLTANGGSGGAPGGQSGVPGNRTSTPVLGGRNEENLNGGDGAAGTQIDGTDGVTNTGLPDGEGSASGAGGAGWIRINTRSGAAEISGLVSPALTTTCATQGTLR